MFRRRQCEWPKQHPPSTHQRASLACDTYTRTLPGSHTSRSYCLLASSRVWRQKLFCLALAGSGPPDVSHKAFIRILHECLSVTAEYVYKCILMPPRTSSCVPTRHPFISRREDRSGACPRCAGLAGDGSFLLCARTPADSRLCPFPDFPNRRRFGLEAGTEVLPRPNHQLNSPARCISAEPNIYSTRCSRTCLDYIGRRAAAERPGATLRRSLSHHPTCCWQLAHLASYIHVAQLSAAGSGGHEQGARGPLRPGAPFGRAHPRSGSPLCSPRCDLPFSLPNASPS